MIVATLYFQVKKEKQFHPFATNFKNCLKNSGKYIVLVGIFLFLYLKFINPGFLLNLKESRIEMERAREPEWNIIQENNDFYKDTTWEEYMEKAESSAEILSSISLNLSFYFLFLFIISVFFSIMVPIFYKKIVLRM